MLPALQTWPGGRRDDGSRLVELSLDLTAPHLSLEDFLLPGLGGVLGSPAKPGGDTELVLLVTAGPRHVVDAHLDGTLVAGTAEAGDDLLGAARYGRGTALLETDDVTSETEAEVARIVPGDLLG